MGGRGPRAWRGRCPLPPTPPIPPPRALQAQCHGVVSLRLSLREFSVSNHTVAHFAVAKAKCAIAHRRNAATAFAVVSAVTSRIFRTTRARHSRGGELLLFFSAAIRRSFFPVFSSCSRGTGRQSGGSRVTDIASDQSKIFEGRGRGGGEPLQRFPSPAKTLPHKKGDKPCTSPTTSRR